jgi:hypothetical protein
MACDIFADKPEIGTNDDGNFISGVGHRECSGSPPQEVEVTVRLRQDRRFWFDKTLASKTKRIKTGTVTVVYNCQGTSSQTVFTEIIVQGKKAKSPTRGVSLCS